MTGGFDRRQTLGALAAFAGLGLTARAGPGQGRAGAGLPAGLRRGFNLPDQVPRRVDRIAEAGTLARLRARGMTHIRLPVVAEALLPEFSGPATRGAALDDLDRTLGRLLEPGYDVSVDMHAGPEFERLLRNEPQKAQAALRAGWRGLSERLKPWPASRVFAELLNEPATSDDIWRPFAEDLAREVRTFLPDTTLIVGPAPFQRVDALPQWRPFADRNIVYAVHFYDPMVFTHQGLTWDQTSPYANLAGIGFPLAPDDPSLRRQIEAALARGDQAAAEELRKAARRAWTPATIGEQFAAAAAWSVEHSAPVVVNEFGVLRFKAPRGARLAWLAAVRAAAEAEGFGWAHWDYSGGFGLLDESGALDMGVIDALLPRG